MGAVRSVSLGRQPDGTDLYRTGHRGRPIGAVCNLFGGDSCRHHSPATASACRRFCEDVQSRLNCRIESGRNYSGLIDAVVLEEVAMDTAVEDETVQRDKVQAIATRPSPSVDDASTRQAGEIDTVARRASESDPGKKPIFSPSGTSTARRRGGTLRNVRLLLRKVATAAIAVFAVVVALVTW